MPIYEYECTNCKFYVESLQKISDPPLKKCPSCKKQTMKRLVSAPVFRLKGGGWYETDFKSDQEGKRNLAGGEEAAEAKPEADKDKDKDKEAKPEESVKESDKKPAAEPKKSATKKPAARPAAKASSKAKAKAKAKAKPAKRAAKRRR